jgi:predicted ester cyclase
VWCILEGTGFHRGKLGPLPASGAVLHWGVSDICRLREGEIVEHGGIPDRMAIAEQFGMPAPSRWLIRFLMGKRPR